MSVPHSPYMFGLLAQTLLHQPSVSHPYAQNLAPTDDTRLSHSDFETKDELKKDAPPDNQSDPILLPIEEKSEDELKFENI